MLYDTLATDEKGNLTFCGVSTKELAEEYSTPLYVLDLNGVENRCLMYKNAMEKHFGASSSVLYAGKALSYKGIYKIAEKAGIGVDIVSPGELYTAAAAGFPLSKAYFHGNNKTDEDIRYAMSLGMGYFVCDGIEELCAINEQAAKAKTRQKILLRLTPGIDAHTHKKITTGIIDSKFGTPIVTGAAKELTEKALSMEHIELCGYHCHIGSQIFSAQPFCDAAEVMLDFIAQMKASLGYSAQKLNLGGGFGVRYTEDDPEIDYEEYIGLIASTVKNKCRALGIDVPHMCIEPGRSIVADNGITLYTVGSVKKIPGVRNYVSIDGGMTDNPRFALYSSAYTVINASKACAKADFTASVVGRCCESGDIIAEDAALAEPERSDILAVLTTGAYNYSMASNYNRLPRPALIGLSGEKISLEIKRESFDELIRNDM